MPIRRPRKPKATLRHVAFLERMEHASNAKERIEAKASFLTLRLFEQWIGLGALLASPKARAHAAAAAAVKEVRDAGVAEILGYLLRGVAMLREPDPQPFLRRVYQLGERLERDGAFAAAGECYALVTRHTATDEPILVDARVRRGFCHRAVGDLQWAELEFQHASAAAATMRDEWRTLVARIGPAKVLMDTGRVREGDALMHTVARRLDGAPRTPAPPTPGASSRDKPTARKKK